MDLEIINLGPVDGYVMTNLFVVLSYSVSEKRRNDVLVLCHAEKPFANVGFHQEALREIDIDYCTRHSIPVVRRVIGGGAIADGPWEEDYFLISRLGSKTTEGTLKEYYGRMLEPVSSALHRLGLNTIRQGLNDLAVEGRKISANGAVDIEDARVLTGDILLDLNIEVMSGILKVPDEKFRDKMAKTMEEHLTGIRQILGRTIERHEIDALLAEEFGRLYDGARSSEITEQEKKRLALLVEERKRHDWIFSRDSSRNELFAHRRIVKIKEGTFLCKTDYKAQKLIRVTMLVESGIIKNIAISGDFFTVPVSWKLERLERHLEGVPLRHEDIRARVAALISQDGVTLLGAEPGDFASAIMDAATHPSISVEDGDE
jgi:lipoate-protein ligase A